MARLRLKEWFATHPIRRTYWWVLLTATCCAAQTNVVSDSRLLSQAAMAPKAQWSHLLLGRTLRFVTPETAVAWNQPNMNQVSCASAQSTLNQLEAQLANLDAIQCRPVQLQPGQSNPCVTEKQQEIAAWHQANDAQVQELNTILAQCKAGVPPPTPTPTPTPTPIPTPPERAPNDPAPGCSQSRQQFNQLEGDLARLEAQQCRPTILPPDGPPNNACETAKQQAIAAWHEANDATVRSLTGFLNCQCWDEPAGDVSANPSAGVNQSNAGLIVNLAGSSSDVYAVSLDAGVWKSSSGGPWMQLANSPRYAFSIAVDSANPSHLAVGERNGDAISLSANKTGVWESNDGGNSWTLSLNPMSQTACSVSAAIPALMFSSNSTLIAGTPCGIARKASGSSSFDFSSSPSPTYVTALAQSRRADGAWILWALAWNSLNSVALWSSLDDGATWTVESVPANVNGYQIILGITGGSPGNVRGDALSLAAFEETAIMSFGTGPGSDPNVLQNLHNNNTLLYHTRGGSWSVQQLAYNNGTGLGGRRNLKSFVVDPNVLPATMGKSVRIFMNGGQDFLEATGQSNGQLTWNRIALAQCAGCNSSDSIHSDLWDMYLDSAGVIHLASDGGVYRSVPGGKWASETQGLSTHSIHTITALHTTSTPYISLAYTTSDNDAWLTGPPGSSSAQWTSPGAFGDANWSAADAANQSLVLVVRSINSIAQLLTFGTPPPAGANNIAQNIVVSNDSLSGNPSSFQFIQTLPGEAANFPLLDAVMLVNLPLQYKNAQGQLTAVPGSLGTASGVALIRNRAFAANPDINLSHGSGWQLEASNLPADTVGFAVSGGHEGGKTIYYAYTNSGSLLKRIATNNWKTLSVTGVLAGSPNGPLFVNPYNPNALFVLTTGGIQESFDGGSTFAVDAQLTSLVTGAGKYPLTAFFSGGDLFGPGYPFTVPEVSRANLMGTLSSVAFSMEHPSAMVATSPFTGLFFNDGTSGWLDLTSILPSPFTPLSSVAIAHENIYVATEGRGLLVISGYGPLLSNGCR